MTASTTETLPLATPAIAALDYRDPLAIRRPAILGWTVALGAGYGVVSILCSVFGVMVDGAHLYDTFGPPAPPAAPPAPGRIPAGAVVLSLTMYHYNPTLLAVSLCACLCNAVLAAILLVGCRRVLRKPAIAPRPLWVFAIAKIPVSIVAAATSLKIQLDVNAEIDAAVKAVSPLAVSRPGVGFLYAPSLLTALFACTFVFALIVVLCLPDVKRYFVALR